MNSYQFTKEDTKKCTTVFITPQTVKVIEGVDQEQILEMKVTLIAPKIFRYFQTVDYPMIDIHSSLDLNKNRERIKDFSAPDGGKSGEFFFFTWDNKLILKTLGQGELQSIKRRLEHYGNYLYNQ
jgi:1-phosphatidylinositol-4-phosphate 5-kinase